MRKLAEAFPDPSSRVDRVIMFIDMTNSTDMKLKTSEASWLTTYGWFFDTIREIIEEKNGYIVKYLGDGVMAAFTEDYATEAINAAIKIQEAVAAGNAYDTVRCQCTIGIAYGSVVEFETPQQAMEQGSSVSHHNIDYIGSVVDKAARLCAAASPKAVFVDTDTTDAASMNKIISTLGAASPPKRTSKQYVGDAQLVPVKGFPSPIEYHEILWGDQRYGLKSSVATEVVEAETQAIAKAPPTPERSANEHRRGSVKTWDSSRGMGFIRSNDEDFYLNRSFLVYDQDLQVGETVFFVTRDPLSPGKNRVATCACVFGEELKGTVVKIGPNFGFVQVSDAQGNTRDLFMHLGNNSGRPLLGDDVIFTIGENDRGVCAESPRPFIRK